LRNSIRSWQMTTRWECDRCGYTHDHKRLECRSCGCAHLSRTGKSRPGDTRRVLYLFALVLIAALAIAFAVSGSAPALIGTLNDSADELIPTDTPRPAVDIRVQNEGYRDATTPDADGLNTTRVELLIHKELNERRAEYGRTRLLFDYALTNIARQHSRDMVRRDFFAHENPDGHGFAERYASAGYDCRVPTGDGRYLTGAENIAMTYYQEPIINDTRHDTPAELAEGIVQQWMNSTAHRENLLVGHWRAQGIGVVVTEDENGTAVYVTQNFC